MRGLRFRAGDERGTSVVLHRLFAVGRDGRHQFVYVEAASGQDQTARRRDIAV